METKEAFKSVSETYPAKFDDAVNKKIQSGYVPLWDTYTVTSVGDGGSMKYSICMVYAGSSLCP